MPKQNENAASTLRERGASGKSIGCRLLDRCRGGRPRRFVLPALAADSGTVRPVKGLEFLQGDLAVAVGVDLLENRLGTGRVLLGFRAGLELVEAQEAVAVRIEAFEDPFGTRRRALAAGTGGRFILCGR